MGMSSSKDMAKIPRSIDDLQLQLQQQLGFLKRSSEAFDQGHEEEAKRLAVNVRTLVHDTNSSTSLFTQLDLKGKQFFDTALPSVPGNQAAQHPLVRIAVSGNAKSQSSRFLAPLDGARRHEWVDFDTWWGRPVLVDAGTNSLSRKNLVLTMANQDGGAHVDPELNKDYAAALDPRFFSTQVLDKEHEWGIRNAAFASVRQIAHEVIKTLEPEFEQLPDESGFGMLVEQVAAFGDQAKDSNWEIMPMDPWRKKIGRNAMCPCGSGKKFKHCHIDMATAAQRALRLQSQQKS